MEKGLNERVLLIFVVSFILAQIPQNLRIAYANEIKQSVENDSLTDEIKDSAQEGDLLHTKSIEAEDSKNQSFDVENRADGESDTESEESVENTSFLTARQIDINKQYSDVAVNNKYKYYKFVLDEPGTISLFMKLYDYDSFSICLYSLDDIDHPLDAYTYKTYSGNGKKFLTTDVTGLSAGTYFLEIFSFGWNGDDYTFRLNFEAKDHYEQELNDSFDKADNIVCGESYHGKISDKNKIYSSYNNYDYDYYKFTVSSNGYIDFSFLNDDDDFVDYDSYNLSVFNANDLKNQVFSRSWELRGTNEVTVFGACLPKGEYYLVIGGEEEAKYTFSVNFNVSDYYENESDDDFDEANFIKLNTTYTGNIMNATDNDIYTFYLKNSGDISINFSNDYDLSCDGWAIYLYDYNEKQIGYLCSEDEGSTTSDVFNLSEGQYFVEIIGAYSYCPYHLRINSLLSVIASENPVVVGNNVTMQVEGNQGGELTYTSSNPVVASVDSLGNVMCKSPGTARISVTSAEDSNSAGVTGSVSLKVMKPGKPGSVNLEDTAKGIKVTWNKVDGVTGYQVYRSTNDGGYVKAATLNSSTSTYNDQNAKSNGSKYNYKIYAYKTAGDSTFLSEASEARTIYHVAAASIKKIKNNAAKTITVSWGKNTKGSGYQLQYSTDKSFSRSVKSINISSANINSRVIKKLSKKRTYYVRMRVYKESGNTKYYSVWSPVKSVKIKK